MSPWYVLPNTGGVPYYSEDSLPYEEIPAPVPAAGGEAPRGQSFAEAVATPKEPSKLLVKKK